MNGQRDALDCGSYREIELLDHAMKVLEGVIEKKVRRKVVINNIQFWFQIRKRNYRCDIYYQIGSSKIFRKEEGLVDGFCGP